MTKSNSSRSKKNMSKSSRKMKNRTKRSRVQEAQILTYKNI